MSQNKDLSSLTAVVPDPGKYQWVKGKVTGIDDEQKERTHTIGVPNLMPGIIIFVHGVNSDGGWYLDASKEFARGLNQRLGREDLKGLEKDTKGDEDKVTANRYLKSVSGERVKSPVIPFWWGYQTQPTERKIVKGTDRHGETPAKTDLYGNPLRTDGAWGGGPFQNGGAALTSFWLPTGFRKDVLFGMVDVNTINPVVGRVLCDCPPRLYYAHAARRLANLVKDIRKNLPNEPINIVSRYQPAAASPARFLHVSGVGLRVDHVPAGPLWDRVQRRGSPDEEEPTPPGSLDKCREMAGLFRSAALRAALTHRPRNDERGRFVENYPLPTTMALPPSTQTDRAALAEWSSTYQSSERTGGVPWQLQNGPAGMAFHQLGFKTRPSFEVAGVDLWRSACNAFDTQGDLNSLLVWAEDGYAVRAELGGWENPKGQRSESFEDILARPKRPGQLRDTFSGLLLTRPEAAEWLREWSLHVRDASQDSRFPNGVVARGPHGFDGLHTEAYDGGVNYRVSRGDFKPTPNVPSLWSRPQYDQYSQMPTLALLLKPRVAGFGADMSEDQRAQALEAALRSTLEDSLLERPPKRLFYSAASDRYDDATALLARCMAKLAPQSGLLDIGAGFRLEQCLGGELGAASMNAAIGLASIAVWETNEPALVVNLRDPRGALVFGLLPPSAEQRARTSARPYVI